MPGVSERQRRVLSKIYASQFTDKSRLDYLSQELETSSDQLLDELAVLRKANLIFGKKLPRLAPAGREEICVVMAGGTFDIVHPGHLETLEQARALGDALVVSVARDATFRRNKGRDPLHNESMRRRLVSALKSVDAAILGSEHEILKTAVKVSPDIIALGYDQRHDGIEIRKQLARRGVKVRIVRLKSTMPDIKTRKILQSSHSLDVV
jgi:cytidyltransferase-like protein